MMVNAKKLDAAFLSAGGAGSTTALLSAMIVTESLKHVGFSNGIPGLVDSTFFAAYTAFGGALGGIMISSIGYKYMRNPAPWAWGGVQAGLMVGGFLPWVATMAHNFGS